MKSLSNILLAAGGLTALALFAPPAVAQDAKGVMTFFVTSTNPGKGADLGGLEGADAHCQQLAKAAGAGGHEWVAYLSTQGDNAVNARDRIGAGPWVNAKGVEIAKDVKTLHTEQANINKETALTEKGEQITGVGDKPNLHDILTGSQPDGTAFAVGEDRTCNNWTSSTEGAAMLGHHDRRGREPGVNSWNSAHPSRGGCSMEALKSTGGGGLLYCFARN